MGCIYTVAGRGWGGGGGGGGRWRRVGGVCDAEYEFHPCIKIDTMKLNVLCLHEYTCTIFRTVERCYM